jgi:nitrous oxidase accessory protein NosD
MKRRERKNLKIVPFAFMLATISLAALISALNVQPTRAATHVVPDDYSTIQGAIDAASNGDTIFVRNGVYYENLDLDKAVNLTGESNVNTIIDGSGPGPAIHLDTSDAIIQGFTIRFTDTKQTVTSSKETEYCSETSVRTASSSRPRYTTRFTETILNWSHLSEP